MSIRQLLLVSGAIGSGKSSVAKALQADHGFQSISSGAYLRSIGQVYSREDLQNLGDRLDNETDFKWLIDEVAWPMIDANPRESKWLLDAVRKQRQVEHFRDRFGPGVHHIHLFAPEDVLVARYSSRQDSDSACYEAAVRHSNEQAARALLQSADASYDSSVSTAEEIAQAILHTWKQR